MPPPAHRAGRASGLAAAAGVALVLAAIVAFALWNRSSEPAPPPLPSEDALPPDIRDAPRTSLGASQASFVAGGKFRYEIADRDDPSKLAGVLLADSAKRLDAGSHLLANPQVWYFLSDGRVLRFKADSGKAFLPTEDRGSRPETGQFEGHCTIELFQRPLDRPVDPARDAPLLTGRTSRMLYDGTLSQVTIPDLLTVTSDSLDFAGRDILIQFNEASKPIQAAVRIEKLDAPIKYWPSGRALASTPTPAPSSLPAPVASTTSTPAPSAPPPSPTASAAHPAPPPPPNSFYRLSADSSVLVTLGQREVRADRLLAWAHLIDNKLPDGAVATPPKAESRASASTPSPTTTTPTVQASSSTPPSLPTAPAPNAATPPDSTHGRPDSTPITLWCTGPLELRPIADKPPELAHNDVALAFEAKPGRDAAFHDPETRAAAHASRIEYGATNLSLALAGSDANPARLLLESQGLATAPRFEVNLNNASPRAIGKGELVALASASNPQERRVAWTDSADFVFATDQGRLTSRLREAVLAGGFSASADNATLSGDHARATFADDPRDPNKQLIASLAIEGSARATDGRDSTLHADHIDASFIPGPKPGESDPAHLLARGNVHATRGVSTLAAQSLLVDLARDPANKLALSHAHAQGDVRFTGENGLWASAQDADLDGRTQTLDLAGPNTRLGQRDSTLACDQVRLEGADAQRLTAFGPGTLDHAQTDPAGVTSRLALAWSRQMTYDDRQGLAEAAGTVIGHWSTGDLAKDSIAAERAKVWFTSAPTGPRPASTPAEARRVLRAEITGQSAERADGPRASLTSLRFTSPPTSTDPAPFERALYLEGDTIRLDNAADPSFPAVEVPGPGKLFALDARAAAQSRNERGEPLFAPGATKGRAVFSWKGALSSDRDARRVRMTDKVTMIHDRPAPGDLMELECDALTASLADAPGTQPAPRDSREPTPALRAVEAQGAVWMRADQRELVASRATYDALAGLVDAAADPGAIVTFSEAAGASTLTAAQLKWNLSTGRAEVIKPGTLVAPR